MVHIIWIWQLIYAFSSARLHIFHNRINAKVFAILDLLILLLMSANNYVPLVITQNYLHIYVLWIAGHNTNIKLTKHVLVVALKLIIILQIYIKTIIVTHAKMFVFLDGIQIMWQDTVNLHVLETHLQIIQQAVACKCAPKTQITMGIIIFAILSVLFLDCMLKIVQDNACNYVRMAVTQMISIEDVWISAHKSSIHL